MDVVRNSSNDERLTSELVGRAAQNVEQFIAPFVGQFRLTIFCRKNEMNVYFGKRLRYEIFRMNFSAMLYIYWWQVERPLQGRKIIWLAQNPGLHRLRRLRPGLIERPLQGRVRDTLAGQVERPCQAFRAVYAPRTIFLPYVKVQSN